MWSSMMRRCNEFADSKLATPTAAGLLLALLVVGTAVAQEASEQAEPPPPLVARPGIFDVIERWFEDSRSKIKDTQQVIEGAAKDAADKAGQASGGMLGLPGSKVARGRVRCTVAPNGAPDCAEAANALCRSKGFGPGKSVDINTADKCPTWVWLSGRPAPEGTCTTETFVLQAACQ
jgi:hypothetical protein